jgi:hypothetical protein
VKLRHAVLGVAGVLVVAGLHWLRDPSSVRETLLIAVAVIAVMAVFEYFMYRADSARRSS